LQIPGDSQYSLYVLRGSTCGSNTACNATYLYLDGSSLEMALPSNRSVAYNINIVARSSGSGAQTTVFLIRGGASGTTQSVGTPLVDLPLNEFGFSPTQVQLSVSGGFLHILVIGVAGTAIDWTATVRNAEESF
jgi:hypothetical protein